MADVIMMVGAGDHLGSLLHRLIVAATVRVMSLEAARALSIPELLRVLNEKFDLVYTKLRETRLHPVVPIASFESEVSTPQRQTG